MLVHYPDFKTVWYVVEWLIRLGAIGVVPIRRSPAAAASWLLLILFFPIGGLFLYLVIGRPTFSPARDRRWRAIRPFFGDTAAAMEREAGGGGGAVGAFAQTLGRLPCVGGNAVELIDDYDDVVDRLVADIEGAIASVDLLVYIFADDQIGQRVAAALERATARGVQCRVIFDPVGSRLWRRGTLRLLATTGAKVREALPAHLLRRKGRADMRNHRKLFVIDGRIGYAGSQNLVAKDFRPGVVNRELVVRTAGPIVAAMQSVIDGDWQIEGRSAPDPAPVSIPEAEGTSRLQLLPSGADFPLEGFKTLLVWLLHRATRHAVLVTPYFVPDDDVVNAMRSAAARGVIVDLVVSAVVDQRIVHLAQCSYFEELLVGGVRIHRYRDYLLHAKNVAIDGAIGIVGSSNVDLRSFQLNEEVSLLLHDSGEIQRLEAIQSAYIKASDPIDLAVWRARPRFRRLFENIARIMSPLL